jgi:uncharacterized protein (DUF2141 family)
MKAFLALVLLTSLAAQEAQIAVANPEATAAIKGRVLRADGRPLGRARVRLAPLPTTPGRQRVLESELDGSFAFTALPAGQYRLFASKTGYLGIELGQRRPREPGLPLRVNLGETLEKIDITLPRPSAIVGRIVDESGDPIEGASVRALRIEFVRGRRQLVEAGTARLTNDLGRYRVYGLQPGRYIVSAAVGQIMFPGPPVADLRGYAPTYFPGTPTATAAAAVTVDVSQDAAGIDFALTPAKTARVSGKALSAAGEPISGGILLSPSQRSGGVAMKLGARTHADGSFEFRNVAPGEYVIQIYRGRVNGFTEGEFVSQFVSVNGVDVPNLMLRTMPGASITGRVTMLGGKVRPGGIEIVPVATDVDTAPLNGGAPIRAAIRNDGTFTLAGLSGSRRLRLARAPIGWALKGIYQNGADITDTVLTFDEKQRALTDVEVVLTSQITELMGAAIDSAGQRVADYAVVVFSMEPERWYAQSRFCTLARPQADGTFQVRGLPPGEYFVAALNWVQGDEWQDPALLESLATRATRVTLTEGQHATAIPSLIVR